MSSHTCHWLGCQQAVAPKLFACKQHWLLIPADLKLRLKAAYTPGQEIRKTASREYLAAALEIRSWIRSNNKD